MFIQKIYDTSPMHFYREYYKKVKIAAIAGALLPFAFLLFEKNIFEKIFIFFVLTTIFL